MAFGKIDPSLGMIKLTDYDVAGPGPVNLVTGTGSGRLEFPFERVDAYDPILGGGQFVFGQAAVAISAGQACKFINSISAAGIMQPQLTPWDGVSNTGEPLSVAYIALSAGQWGWFQVAGCSIVTAVNGSAANAPVYYTSPGAVQSTAVAGKQMLGAKFATTTGVTLGTGSSAMVLTGTQAVILLNQPRSQGAIT